MVEPGVSHYDIQKKNLGPITQFGKQEDLLPSE